MILHLDANEARALGSLVEKSLTTPDQYPLSFNALLDACNQKTSRDPVMSLDPDSLGAAVSTLIEKGLVDRIAQAGARVPKFRHHIEVLLPRADSKEVGAICVLLLRGPQTPGEIKTRTDRLCEFESTAAVEALLQDLSTREDGPYVARLPRQPGQKENRYRHLFSGGAPSAPEPAATAPTNGKTAPAPGPDRVGELEKRVEALEARLSALEGVQAPKS